MSSLFTRIYQLLVDNIWLKSVVCSKPMDNKTIENQLRYWRNTLADAARHEILVDKQLAIRNVGINLHAGLIDSKQTAQLFEWIERRHNDSKGLGSSFNSNRGVIDKIPVLITPFRVSPVPEFARANRVTGVFYPFGSGSIAFIGEEELINE